MKHFMFFIYKYCLVDRMQQEKIDGFLFKSTDVNIWNFYETGVRGRGNLVNSTKIERKSEKIFDKHIDEILTLGYTKR